VKTLLRSLAISLLLGVAVLGCKNSELGGTGTGNPGGESTDGNSFPQNVADAVCSRLSHCNSGALSFSTCRAAVYAESNIDTEIGLAVGQYPNLQAVIEAESAMTLIKNVLAASQCLADIAALSCADALVQAAYQPANPDPFVGVAAMIPTAAGSCVDYY
jgi:hypothetical protein